MLDILNINQPIEEVDILYGPMDYYWYLRSPQFRTTFLAPIGAIINRLGGDCIDVGCGEGQLGDYVKGNYIGIDASPNAIKRGRAIHSHNKTLIVGRIENPQLYWAPTREFCKVIVFGGVMEVLIKKECRVQLLNLYREMFSPSYFIIYDLARLDTSLIEEEYGKPIDGFQATVNDIDIIPEKKTRKVLVYEVSK